MFIPFVMCERIVEQLLPFAVMVTSTADGAFNLPKQLCFVLGLYKGLYKKIYVWRLKIEVLYNEQSYL